MAKHHTFLNFLLLRILLFHEELIQLDRIHIERTGLMLAKKKDPLNEKKIPSIFIRY